MKLFINLCVERELLIKVFHIILMRKNSLNSSSKMKKMSSNDFVNNKKISCYTNFYHIKIIDFDKIIRYLKI